MAENNKKITTINKEGKTTVATVLLSSIALNIVVFLPNVFGWYSFVVAVLSILFFLLLLNFFRNPKRVFPSEDTDKVVVAPADGSIVAIEEVDELDYFNDRRVVISIFMSIFSVHANWFPVNGTVTKVEHQKGNFHAAYKAKSSTENERSMVIIKTPEGEEVMVRQIAGACARRIVTYPKVGDKCHINQHLGFIKLGSRVDVYLPVNSLICAKINQKTKADITILAKLP